MALKGKRKIFVDAYLGVAKFNASEAARIAEYKSPGSEGHRLLKIAEIAEAISNRIADITMDRNETLVMLADQARATLEDFITLREVREPVVVQRLVRDILNDLLTEIQFEETYAVRAKLDGEVLTDHNARIAAMRQRALRLEMKLEMDPDAKQDVTTTETRWRAEVDLKKAEKEGKLHLLQSYNPDTGRIELVPPQKALELIGKHHALFVDKIDHSGQVQAVVTSEGMAAATKAAREWERKQFGKAAS